MDGSVNSFTAGTMASAYLLFVAVEAVRVKLGSWVLVMSLAVTVTGMLHTRAVLAGRAAVAGLKLAPVAVSSLQSDTVMFWGGKVATLLTIFRLELAATGLAPLISTTV
jgi:hypothetical protein